MKRIAFIAVRLVYSTLLHLAFTIYLPIFIYQALRYGKYRHSFIKRLLPVAPPISKSSFSKVVWFHAVSLGETKALAPLVKMWREKSPNDCILFSNITETGFHEVEEHLPEVDHHFYLHFDLPYIIRPFVKKIAPDKVIIAESDYWWHFMDSAKQTGAQVYIVNGKLSNRSFQRYCQLPIFVREWMLGNINLFCVQNRLYAQYFHTIGIKSDNIKITGNLKLDHTETPLSNAEREQFCQQLGIRKENYVITIGSTHPKEEEYLLGKLLPLLKEIPNLRFLIVPRHPERFKSVSKLLKDLCNKFSCRYQQWSDLKAQLSSEKSGAEVSLIDGMGVLKRCYQISQLAIVAGSYVPIGGHNIMEPAVYGIPVIYGPYMHQQPELVTLMKSYNCNEQISLEQLSYRVKEIIENSDLHHELGKAAQIAYLSQKGSVLLTWSTIN